MSPPFDFLEGVREDKAQDRDGGRGRVGISRVCARGRRA